MQDKTNENQSINQKGLMHDEEMKRTLDSLKETKEKMNFTPAEELALIEFINAIGETRKSKEIPKCVEQMLEYLKDKSDNFQLPIQIQLDEIYRLIDDEPKNLNEIERLLKKTGLDENHPEYLRVETMIHFLD